VGFSEQKELLIVNSYYMFKAIVLKIQQLKIVFFNVVCKRSVNFY